MAKQTPKIHLFYCANSLTKTEVEDLQARFGCDGLKTLSLPCSGKMTIPYLLKAFEKGADGIVLSACPESQCKHLEGALRASKRAATVDRLLEEIGFGKGHVLVVTKEQDEIEKLVDSIQRFRAVCSVPVRASEKPPHGVITGDRARAVLAGIPGNNRRENAA